MRETRTISVGPQSFAPFFYAVESKDLLLVTGLVHTNSDLQQAAPESLEEARQHPAVRGRS